MRSAPHPAARPTLAAFSVLVALIAGDLMVGRLVPRVRVFSELLEGEPYPAVYSDYLPITTPAGVTFRHEVEGRQIEYRFNPLGYRGPHPRTLRQLPGVRRVLVCGDSFVLGWGNPLERTFVDLLSRRLEPRGYEVINAGYRGGYSPDSYYAYLLREGLALQPALAIIALYTGNDLTDMRYNLWRRTDQLGAPVELGTMRLYMDHLGKTIHPPERLREILPWGYRVPWARQSHLFAAAAQAVDRGVGRNRLPPEEARRRFAVVARATGRLLDAADVELAYLLIPADPRRATTEQRAAGAYLAATLGTDHTVIDLAPRLDGTAFFDHDAHFNARGNHLAFEALMDGLIGAGLITSDGATAETGETRP